MRRVGGSPHGLRECETSGNELSSHPPIPRPLWWLPSRYPSLNLAVFPYSSPSHTNLTKSYQVYLLLQSQVLFQFFLIFWSHLLCPGPSPPPGCLQEASKKANLSVSCLKTLQWSPLPLSWGSRSLACPDGARWSALPIPLTRCPPLLLPAPCTSCPNQKYQTMEGSTHPHAARAAPSCSCQPYPPPSPGQLHSSFKTVQKASPPESLPWAHEEESMCFLRISHPSICPIILFTFPSALTAGRSLKTRTGSHSSFYTQHRTAAQGYCRHFLKFESDCGFN